MSGQERPGTPYKITVGFLAQNPIYTNSFVIPQFGVCWRESGTGKLLTYGWGSNNYPMYIQYAQWTNETTVVSGLFQLGRRRRLPIGFASVTMAPTAQ